MSQRQIIQVFEQYQKSRMQFVQTVADLANRPQNIEFLQNAGVMSLLRPLMLDVVPGIQQTAALALSRLADHSYDLAEAVVNEDILPQLVHSLASQNRFYKKAAASVLRAVAKHSPGLSQAVVECGGVDALVLCLEDFDPGVKEAAAWALGIIARHDATSTLSDISKHTAELAQAVVDTGAIAHLAQMILNPDAKLKSKEALKSILQKCTYLPGLESLLYDAPSNILKHVVCQFSKVLPHDSKARRLFVTSGGLKKVQEIDAEPGSPLQEYINAINSCFPEEIVRYYSPGYSEVLLERLENYQPA
ncbi:putative sperm-associated antigen 6-like [Scophthalmus maximus]|uniref:Putative sperm-associated antigen 6-like n=1 Tax=Scophthalmus maximus TaxID=52904 RepID=A0A2U9CXA1_SCOMX|nr:putative sperm-associated antigen 6-like [Scophthalmus maximus]